MDVKKGAKKRASKLEEPDIRARTEYGHKLRDLSLKDATDVRGGVAQRYLPQSEPNEKKPE